MRPTQPFLPQAIHQHALADPARIALVFAGGDGPHMTVSYGRLHSDASAFGHRLQSEGIAQGNVVALAMGHGYSVITGFLGAMYIGAVPVILPYHTLATPDRSYRERAVRLLGQVEARAVLALPRAMGALTELEGVRPIGWSEPEPSAEPPDGRDPVLSDPAHPAYLQLTSGSTRTPRGVVIQVGALRSHLDALSKALPFAAPDTSVGWLPLHHDMGLVTQVLLPLASGATSVLLAPQAWLRRPVALMRAVHEHCGTLSTMPNFGFGHCLRRISDADMEGLDLSSWRTLVCGGEPIRAQTMERFTKRFAKLGLSPGALMAGYGMAENTVGVTHSPRGDGIRVDRVARAPLEAQGKATPAGTDEPDAVEIVSCGIALPGTQVEVVDTSGMVLPERRIGEIRIRGDSLFAGYRDGTGATVNVERDGWFHTGDRGYLAGGELHVLGREDDLIISAGRNISPAEIEATILDQHEGEVRCAVAFGVHDDRLGTEVPVAVVEIPGRVELARRSELARLIREHLMAAAGVALGDLRLVESGWIEVTTSGKVARRASRTRYLDAGFRGAVPGQPETRLDPFWTAAEVESELTRLVAEISGRPEVDPHARLSDLGLDSLGLVNLVLLLEERSDRHIGVAQLALDPTLSEWASYLASENSTPPQSGTAAESASVPLPRHTKHHLPLKERLRKRGPALRGRALVPYGTGSRILHRLASHAGIRQRTCGAEIELLARWMERVPLAADPEVVIRQSLMVNSWSNWRTAALADPRAFAQWVTVKGSEVLEELEDEGRGAVLAVPHTLLRRLMPRLWFMVGADVSIVGNVAPGRMIEHGPADLSGALGSGRPLSRAGVRSAQLVHALRTLAEGGRALVFADDDAGAGGIDLPFHGCTRRFRPGAAELAVRTDAALVPVFASMALSGRITFECLPPLAVQGASHADRVESLLRGYAALLAQRYTVDLGAMDWYILRKFVDDRSAEPRL